MYRPTCRDRWSKRKGRRELQAETRGEEGYQGSDCVWRIAIPFQLEWFLSASAHIWLNVETILLLDFSFAWSCKARAGKRVWVINYLSNTWFQLPRALVCRGENVGLMGAAGSWKIICQIYMYICIYSTVQWVCFLFVFSSLLFFSPVPLDCREEMLHFVLFFKTPPQLPASSLILHTQLKRYPSNPLKWSESIIPTMEHVKGNGVL